MTASLSPRTKYPDLFSIWNVVKTSLLLRLRTCLLLGVLTNESNKRESFSFLLLMFSFPYSNGKFWRIDEWALMAHFIWIYFLFNLEMHPVQIMSWVGGEISWWVRGSVTLKITQEEPCGQTVFKTSNFLPKIILIIPSTYWKYTLCQALWCFKQSIFSRHDDYMRYTLLSLSSYYKRGKWD